MGPQQDPDDPPKWMTYFATDDAAATSARVTAAGGSVLVEPMQVGPLGTMVIFRDPHGHAFGAWQSGEHTGVRVYNEPGTLTWNDAAVDDIEAAKAFYAAVFDFEYTEIEDMGGYVTFALAGESRSVGGLGGHQPGAPKGWTSCFAVSSTDDSVATVERGGGKVTMAAEDTPFGRFAVVEDPWGAAFAVMQELDS